MRTKHTLLCVPFWAVTASFDSRNLYFILTTQTVLLARPKFNKPLCVHVCVINRERERGRKVSTDCHLQIAEAAKLKKQSHTANDKKAREKMKRETAGQWKAGRDEKMEGRKRAIRNDKKKKKKVGGWGSERD